MRPHLFHARAGARSSSSPAGSGCPAEPPHAYLCPITQAPMARPVRAADGQTYERSAIERWMYACPTSGSGNVAGPGAWRSPLTNIWHVDRGLVAQDDLARRIAAWHRRHCGGAVPAPPDWQPPAVRQPSLPSLPSAQRWHAAVVAELAAVPHLPGPPAAAGRSVCFGRFHAALDREHRACKRDELLRGRSHATATVAAATCTGAIVGLMAGTLGLVVPALLIGCAGGAALGVAAAAVTLGFGGLLLGRRQGARQVREGHDAARARMEARSATAVRSACELATLLDGPDRAAYPTISELILLIGIMDLCGAPRLFPGFSARLARVAVLASTDVTQLSGRLTDAAVSDLVEQACAGRSMPCRLPLPPAWDEAHLASA